jgi:RsiW-degrading membrane proteinase PrsW (M82 family)
MPTPRRDSIAFTVVVTVLVAVGALAMLAILALSGAPRIMFLATLLAAVPVGPLVASYLWLDRYEPEPKRLLAYALLWGAFVATVAAILVGGVGGMVVGFTDNQSLAVVAPVTEEASKGLFLLLLLWWRRAELDGILDGIVYAGMVGIGFAFTENILYLSAAYVGGNGQSGGIDGAITLFVIRGVFSPFAHPLFTAFTGIGIGIAVGSRKPAVRFLAPLVGYLLAVCAHAAWNGSLFLGGGETFVLTYLFVMVPGFFLVVGFAIWARRREAKVLTDALTDCARRGFIDPAEIPWLVRLPARRAARKNAQAVGGREARTTMASYQQQAVELGFLHSRFLRGTAPRDFTERGQYLVDAMRQLRPGVVWPATAGRNAAGVALSTGGGQ